MRTAAAASNSSAASAPASMDAASNRHAPLLLLVWCIIAGGSIYAALQRHVSPDLLLLVDSTFWLAVVASISLTEAWVKFRAPLLDRWRGVDVGRRVFRAQYALEGALAAAAAALLLAKAGGSAVNGSDLVRSLDGRAGLLAAAAAVLLCEVAAVFPALDLRGRRAIAEAAAQAPGLTLQQRAYVAELARGVEGEAKAPPPWLHPLSVSLAFAKAGLLAAFVWQQLLALA